MSISDVTIIHPRRSEVGSGHAWVHCASYTFSTVYEQTGVTDEGAPSTSVRYSIASPSFGQRHGSQLTDDDNEHVTAVWTTGRDIANSIVDDIEIETANGETTRFRAECFFNGYNAFCLLIR